MAKGCITTNAELPVKIQVYPFSENNECPGIQDTEFSDQRISPKLRKPCFFLLVDHCPFLDVFFLQDDLPPQSNVYVLFSCIMQCIQLLGLSCFCNTLTLSACGLTSGHETQTETKILVTK